MPVQSNVVYHGRFLIVGGLRKAVITRSLTNQPDMAEVQIGNARDLKSYPEGFDWGNGSAGAAQTALAVLRHFFAGDPVEALAWHQRFKIEVIAKLDPRAEWSMPAADVAEAIEFMREQLAEHAARERFEMTVADQFE
jgi:hypothetical protein